MLPGIDGWQVLRSLHELGDPVPVVVCSAKNNPEDHARAEALGAVAYLHKPFDLDRLVDAVVEAATTARGRWELLPTPDRAPELGFDLA
jgi:CheY-like chemotaxis protein